MKVTGISFPKISSPQYGVVQDHDGRQRGKADWVDVLPKQSVHLEGSVQGLRKYSGV